MVPGLSELLEYLLAAERLHDTPFLVASFLNREGESVQRWTGIKFFVNRVPHTYVARTYEEAHDKAVRAMMVFNRLDRIRGLA